MTLREQRLRAEAVDLQRQLQLNGFIAGQPVSWTELEADPDMIRAQSRLWYIGFALSHPTMPEVP